MTITSGFTNSARYRCLEDLQKESVELCLTYCGSEHCKPLHRFGPNKRSSYVLHIVKDGKGTLEISNKIYNLKKGDAFLIFPGTEAWYEADFNDPWVYTWVGFTGLKSDECTNKAGFYKDLPVRKVECIDQLVSYINEMLEAHQLTYENELKRSALLMLFFSSLIKDYKQNISNKNSTYTYPWTVYVKHAMDYLSSNYSQNIKINELADYIGVNRSYLTICFKKEFGCSPKEFLMDIRTKKAKSLLKFTDMQIKEVAESVGYIDQLAFSKAFKKQIGMSPSDYRKNQELLVLNYEKGEYKTQFQL